MIFDFSRCFRSAREEEPLFVFTSMLDLTGDADLAGQNEILLLRWSLHSVALMPPAVSYYI